MGYELEEAMVAQGMTEDDLDSPVTWRDLFAHVDALVNAHKKLKDCVASIESKSIEPNADRSHGQLGKMIGFEKVEPVEFGKQLGQLVRDCVAQNVKPVEARLAVIEAKGVVYRGAWQAAEEYQRGDLATYDGSMWHANDTTRARPGDGKSWTLAVKAGRDSR